MSHYVYIVASRPGGALYIDVARDLAARGCPERERVQVGLAGRGRHRNSNETRRDTPRLVYYEEFPSLFEALAREKVIRDCSREWKIGRIERTNPDWADLTPGTQPVRPADSAGTPPPQLKPRLKRRTRKSSTLLRYPLS